MKKFVLPDKWHIVVNKTNAEDVLKWRFIESYQEDDVNKFLTYIVGMTARGGGFTKGHNPKSQIKSSDDDYDFGEPITYAQFKKHVLGIKSKRQNYKYLIPILKRLDLENNGNK